MEFVKKDLPNKPDWNDGTLAVGAAADTAKRNGRQQNEEFHLFLYLSSP